MSRRLMWVLLAVVAVGALALGSRADEARTAEERVQDIGRGLRCPTCAGQSVATSDAPAAEAIRTQIRADVEAGRSDDTIRARITASYGDDILLNPPRSGFAGLVWVVPVAAVVVAFGGLALAFRRWERTGPSGPTRRDRALVAAALGQDPDDSHGEGSGR